MSSNKLIHEKSPYLLQHAHNPVNWHAWNEEAFNRARTENKPIMLSIGYATCHWCHVMERESFEDEDVARHLNEAFVCIKVDREERPDIDAVYMTACQMLTGSGGWPLNVFLTPQKKPFFAATYIPKESRMGRIGLIELTRQIKKLWETQPQKVFDSAASIIEHVGKAFNFKSAGEPDQAIFEKAFNEIARSFDGRHGGFEPAPKFPMPHRLLYLLRCYARTGNAKALEMVEKTLTAMRLGGIWDHIGFGFHRYSTDKRWLLPHFEKMLYDQALIAPVYLEAYQATHNPLYACTAEDIFAYVLRDMTSPEGGFYSAEDADSDGEEGKFYIWSTDEFRDILQDQDARLWEQIFNLNPYGNFFDEASGEKNNMNIPHLAKPLSEWAEELGISAEEFLQTWDSIRVKLYRKRENRNHPLKDDKILTDWNGLMIAALAVGARVLGKPAYAEAARKSVRFILDRMRKDSGQLWHRHRDGETTIDATANDYAFLIYGLLQLYQTTFDMALAETAVELQEQMLTDFWDKENSGFFLTTPDDDALPIRPKELYDGALPSANSVALHNLISLSRLTGNPRWEQMAQKHLRCFAGTVTNQPAAFTFFLIGLDFAYHPGQEIIVAGNLGEQDTSNLLTALNLNFSPNQVTQVKSDQNADRLAKFAGYTDGLQVIAGQTTAHLCKGFACKESTSDVETLIKQLQQK